MNKKLKLNLKILKFNDLNKLRSFISKNWKKNHILSKNKKFLIWQHYSNNNLNTAAATIKNKIIGLQMFIPQNHYDAALSKKEISLTIFRCTLGLPILLALSSNHFIAAWLLIIIGAIIAYFQQ